jgi:glycosyltransferase involved in cell wall biosynthesis
MAKFDPVPMSVVIPCYNVEKFIGATIQSVLDQTLPVSEIIIVDDGSTDGSRMVIQRYAEAHPDLIRVVEQKNAGVAVARTRGLEEARFNDVLPLDADDLLHPEAIEALWPYAQAHSEFVVIYGDYYNMTHDGQVGDLVSIGARRTDPLEGHILPTILWENVASAISFVRRDKVLEVGGYYVKAVGAKVDSFEDVFLYLRLLVAGFQMGYVNRPLFYYRNHATNISKDPTRVQNAMRAALAYMFKKAPEQMAEAFYTMRQWRAEQLRDAFESLLEKDAQLAEFMAEIERARVYQQEQETLVAARETSANQYLAEIEQARVTQDELRAAIATQEQKYLTDIERAWVTQDELRAAIATQEQKYLAEIEQARQFQEALQEANTTQAAKLAEHLAEIEQARTTQSELRAAIAAQEQKFLAEIEQARQFQEALQEANTTQAAKLAEYLAEIEQARTTQADLRAAIAAQEQKYLAEIEQARQFQENLQAIIAARHSTIEHYLREIEDARLHQQASQAGYEQKIAELLGEIDRAREFQQQLEAGTNARDATIAQYLAEIEAARTFQEGQQQTISAQAASLHECQSEVERAREYQEILLHRLDVHETFMATLAAQISETRSQWPPHTGAQINSSETTINDGLQKREQLLASIEDALNYARTRFEPTPSEAPEQ